MSEPSLYTATEYSEQEILKGIKISKNTKKIIDDITNTIVDESEEGDSLYCFPQIPIFYVLTGIMPTVKAVVPWFDVATDKTVLEDLESLKRDKPKFMVIAFISDLTMDSHESAFRESGTSAQRKVYEWVQQCVDDGVYEIACDYDLSAEDDGRVRAPYPIKLFRLVDGA